MLIAWKFVWAVGAEAHGTAEEELRDSGAGAAESGAAFGFEENSGRLGNGLKISQFQVHGRKTAPGAGALVEPAEICFSAETAAGNDGIVGVVEQVTHVGLADAAFHGGNFRRAEAQLVIERADFVANAEFAEAPEGVTEVKADIGAIDAVVRQGIVLGINLKRGVAGVGVRREKPAALGAKRAKQFRLDAIGVADERIGAPFGAEAGDVHEGEARAHGEIDVAALRAVDFEGGLEHGRGVIFLYDLDEQPGLAVFLDKAVASGIVAAHAG